MPKGTEERFAKTVWGELTGPLHEALAARVQTCDRESESVASLEFCKEWCQAHVMDFVLKRKGVHLRNFKIQDGTTCQLCIANKARAKVRLTEQPPKACIKHQSQALCLVEQCIVTHKSAHAISKPAPNWIFKSGSKQAAAVHPGVLGEVRRLLKQRDRRSARICNNCINKHTPDDLLRGLLKGLRLRWACARLRRRVRRRRRELRAQVSSRARRARHRAVAAPTSPTRSVRDRSVRDRASLPPPVHRSRAVVKAPSPSSPKLRSPRMDTPERSEAATASTVPPLAVLEADVAIGNVPRSPIPDMTLNAGHAGWPGYHPSGYFSEGWLDRAHLHAQYTPVAQPQPVWGQFIDEDMDMLLVSMFPREEDVLQTDQNPLAINVCEPIMLPPHALPAQTYAVYDTHLNTVYDPFSDDGHQVTLV